MLRITYSENKIFGNRRKVIRNSVITSFECSNNVFPGNLAACAKNLSLPAGKKVLKIDSFFEIERYLQTSGCPPACYICFTKLFPRDRIELFH